MSSSSSHINFNPPTAKFNAELEGWTLINGSDKENAQNNTAPQAGFLQSAKEKFWSAVAYFKKSDAPAIAQKVDSAVDPVIREFALEMTQLYQRWNAMENGQPAKATVNALDNDVEKLVYKGEGILIKKAKALKLAIQVLNNAMTLQDNKLMQEKTSLVEKLSKEAKQINSLLATTKLLEGKTKDWLLDEICAK